MHRFSVMTVENKKCNKTNSLRIMRKAKLTYLLLLPLIIPAVSSCSSDEDFTPSQSDEAKMVTFTMNYAEKAVTRTAPDGYEAFDSSKHPGSMGVYETDVAMFNNQEVDYTSGGWAYSPVKYWRDYLTQSTFDFFAYMPYDANATLTKDAAGTSYTISLPFTIDQCFLTDSKKCPLLCVLPNHQKTTGSVINFDMDQVLGGYTVSFQLDSKMDKIRDFVIKDVKVYGTLAKSGTVSRTYTWADGAWTAGNVTWSNLQTTTVSQANAISIFATENQTLTINGSETGYQQWNGTFYGIPDTSHPFRLQVTYDVTVDEDGDGDGSNAVTRTGIVNTIEISSTNFKNFKQGIDNIGNLQILIQPTYLYVLADDDQNGFVIVQ